MCPHGGPRTAPNPTAHPPLWQTASRRVFQQNKGGQSHDQPFMD